MSVLDYLDVVDRGSVALGETYAVLGAEHADEPEVATQTDRFRRRLTELAGPLRSAASRYAGAGRSAATVSVVALDAGHGPGAGLLRDLHEAYTVASRVRLAWTVLEHLAQSLRDDELTRLARLGGAHVDQQLAGLTTQVTSVAPQALLAST